MRELNAELLRDLVALVKKGGRNLSKRAALGIQLADRFNGRVGAGWSADEPLQTPATGAAAPVSSTDLASEIRNARAQHAELTKQLKELGEDAPAALRKSEMEAADLVRRLVATQADVNPGGDIQGEFNISVDVVGPAGAAPSDLDVPDLVAGGTTEKAELPEAKNEVVPAQTRDPFEDDDG